LEVIVPWQKISAERTPIFPPLIEPVVEKDRPRWSVMIPVFNAGTYLEESLKSVLNQALPEREMQIEVIDDCSTDINIQALIRDIGQGRVGYYRQPYNVGSLRNFETCLNLSRGELVHILHSDDLVHTNFYHSMDSLFKSYPHIGAAFSRFKYIDDRGSTLNYQEAEAPVECVLENWLQRLAEKQRIQVASIAVKREVYEQLGGFCGVHYAEDWEMWARIATRYSFGYTPSILASYRKHEKSILGQSLATAQNLKDLEYVIEKIISYLPDEQRVNVRKESRKHSAHDALRTANQLWTKSKNTKGVLAQIRNGWKMHKDPYVLYKTIRLLGKIMLNK
jgi:glycosyltransferase involved in cell wall biosynthesis